MILSWLELRSFRSYEQIRFDPSPDVNVLLGENGSGKTSLLEAIGYLATLSSFRGSPEASLVAEGASEAIVRGEFSTDGRTLLVEVETPQTGRRRVLVDGKRPRSRAEVASRVAVVSFLPDDLDLVKRGPAHRRAYLNDAAIQLWPVAAAEVADYERTLRQRNALLRRDGRNADRTTLDVLDDRLAGLGAAVWERRRAAIDLLGPEVSSVCERLADEPGRVSLSHEPSGVGLLPTSAEELKETLRGTLRQARQTDLDRRATTVGPHRDELLITMNGRDARTRSSQGEQRSIALALRVGLHRILTEHRGTPPVLLLDDVFSELDAGRSEKLVDLLPRGQVFVTSARSEEVPLVGTRWRVSGGGIRVE